MSLVAVGACYLDTILTTPYYPEEDDKLRASRIIRRRGGNCLNTLEVLQQLVAHHSTTIKPSLHLISVLPAKESLASQQIRSTFEPHVRLDHSIYREKFQDLASCFIIKSQLTGSRTVVNYNELPEMTLEDFIPIADKLGPQATWFHFEGRIPDVVLGCIGYLRKLSPSICISIEAEKPGRPGLQELADAADVIFIAKSWAVHKGYISIEDCLSQQAVLLPKSLIFCTWGAEGAGAYDGRRTRETVVIPAYGKAHAEVVDPVGAGDTFIAGMLYALNCQDKTWSIAQCVEFGTKVAGMKVFQEGFSGLDRALLS